MTTAMLSWRAATGALALLLLGTGVHAAWAQPGYPAASSEWGPGYDAAAAADAIAHENANYWQTVQGKDRGAWWQLDLGQVFPVKGVKIAWARCEDKYHCPPATATVQVSLTGEEGAWKDVRSIAASEIPRDGQPYDPEREWSYPLTEAAPARYVRLLFPDGDQPGAKHDGYLCLGEVEVQAPGLTPQVVTIEGPFGKAELNATYPALVRLYLRGPDGLNEQSLLAEAGRRPWAKGACTYVVGKDEERYESRLARPDGAELTEEDGRSVLRITGVKLSAGGGEPPVATEDWTLSAPGDGSQLIWKIVRRWEKDFVSVMSGSPGLFFSFDARRRANSVTSTIWYDPFRMAARPSGLYALQNYPRRVSQNHIQTIRDRDTWAIYKLWTNWHAPSDLRLEVEGGQLYRRGSFAWLSEAGAVTSGDVSATHTKGQVEEISLKIGGADKYATGYQLAITLPDREKETEASLRDFYVSVLNGGAVNDQKGFDFGNESDGWYYAGSSWMYGMAVAAGTPAPGQLSSRPYDVARAFREHMAHILTRLDDEGRAHFGYNQGGQWVDDNLHTIIGTHAYLLHSGDLHFVRQNLPALERMLAYFIQRRNEQGLFKLDDVGAHWYYDAVSTSGINGYHNSFFYKATVDLAEMEAAAGRGEKAAEYREIAALTKKAFNEVLWKEDAPGGPRYLDWIDAKGQPVSYFCDLCQWPPIAVGIASPEQARKIVATADARIAELEKEYGYKGCAGLSALWPVPESVNPLAKSWQTYGVYMNGGTLLCQTYWEIVARARAGDAKGAYHRLSRFAERAREISWAGDNAFTITGEPKGDGEPYLADMVAATAGAIHGVLGITPTWQKLDVKPCLPSDWPGAEAEVLYKGRRHRVTIEGDKVEIEPLEQVIELPLLWVMDWNLRDSPTGVAEGSNLYFGDLTFVALKRVLDDQGALGLWKLDDEAGPVDDASPHKNHGTIKGEGVSRGQAGHGPAGKGFRFDGNGQVTIPHNDSLASGPEESFTVQCWFNTEATDSRVMVGKPGAFCVYVKESKLAAWLMDTQGRFVEALGSRPVADAEWHHVAAVYDRRAQRLSVYLDGKLDTPDGTPGPRNPMDISSLTDAATPQSLTLGGLSQNSFLYVGLLDEVSIFRGALEPAAFSFKEDYPSPYGTAAVSYPQSGSYQSPPYDWAVPAKLVDLTVTADLNQGSVTATVETSDDEFNTVRSQVRISVKDGVNTYPLDSVEGAARGVRVRLELAPGKEAAASPVVDGFRITATPATTDP